MATDWKERYKQQKEKKAFLKKQKENLFGIIYGKQNIIEDVL